MKKVFLFFVCAAAFAGAKAQVNFGAKAGVNIANITGSDAEGYKSKIGFNVGAFADIAVSEKFSVKPELVYSLQGAKYDGEGDAKTNLSYINLPILAKYDIAQGFFAETGPQVGFLMSAKTKYDGGSIDIKDDIKGIDFGWAFGVGYEFEGNFGVNARYNLGLTSLAEEGDAKVKNGVFQVGVFYSFGGK